MTRKGVLLGLLVLFLTTACSLVILEQGVAEAQVAEQCLTDDQASRLPNDSLALQGVEVGRIFWDVTVADPAQLFGRLGVIDQTYRDMVRQGVTPEMILAFRGGSVRLLASDVTRLSEELRDGALQVHQRLESMMGLPGVHMEACYIAMRRVPLEPENLIPGMHTVNNTFLSAMGYGQKGYHSIPIH